jgi:hypothetical protein
MFRIGILAFGAAVLVFSSVVAGLTPVVVSSTAAFAKQCSKSRCRERCAGRCIQSICDTCQKP